MKEDFGLVKAQLIRWEVMLTIGELTKDQLEEITKKIKEMANIVNS